MLAPSKLLLGTAHEHDTVIASLYQRRLVAISEPDEGSKLREARVKELTGDEQITASACVKTTGAFGGRTSSGLALITCRRSVAPTKVFGAASS